MTTPGRRPPARELLLSAADELFYRQGINSTGVEEVSSRAGVTKATLYNNFGSKEALIAAYLERRLLRWMLDAQRADDPRLDPAARVQALFDLLLDSVHDADFRGCPFTNASVERPDSAPIFEVVRRYRDQLLGHVRAMLDGDDVDARAEHIVMLYDGALVAAKTTGESAPVLRAAEFAVRIGARDDA